MRRFSDSSALGLTNGFGVVMEAVANSRALAHELGHAMGLSGHDGTANVSLMYNFINNTTADIPLNRCLQATTFTSN